MKYTTRLTKKNDSHLKFADVVDVCRKLDPDPIREIKVGFKFYEELLASAKDYVGKEPKNTELYLGSLFGVKVIIDPELKENEYKIVKSL